MRIRTGLAAQIQHADAVHQLCAAILLFAHPHVDAAREQVPVKLLRLAVVERQHPPMRRPDPCAEVLVCDGLPQLGVYRQYAKEEHPHARHVLAPRRVQHNVRFARRLPLRTDACLLKRVRAAASRVRLACIACAAPAGGCLA